MSEPRYTAARDESGCWMIRKPDGELYERWRFNEDRLMCEHLANALTLGIPKPVPDETAAHSEFPGMPPKEPSSHTNEA